MGLGDNSVRLLVTDDGGPEPVVMATYTVHLRRENRPSLPMFGEHVTCGFLQVSPGSEDGFQVPSAGSGWRRRSCEPTTGGGGGGGGGGVFVVLAGLSQKLLKSSRNKKIPVKFFCRTLLRTVRPPRGMWHRGVCVCIYQMLTMHSTHLT